MTLEVAGSLLVALLLVLLARALLRMQPRWPYFVLAWALVICDVAFRHAAGVGVRIPGLELTPARNPAGRDIADLAWPNRVVAFAFTGLALWLYARPQRRSRLVGVGLALAVPAAALNLGEPFLRGYTTDYLVLGDLVLNVADAGLAVGVALACAGVVVAEVRAARAARRPEPHLR